jgi:hypothetical protein
MAGANGEIWLINEQTIGTHRLVIVVFEDSTFLEQPTERKRKQCGTCKVDDVCRTKELNESPHGWAPDDTKGEPGIVHAAGWS